MNDIKKSIEDIKSSIDSKNNSYNSLMILGLFSILLGLCFLYIHQTQSCPETKIQYRYIPRDQTTEESDQYKNMFI
tara:strand:+ start:600 stop:827 length:228 start_codon:yes stop_codon:yes gene_type:complete